MGVMVGLAGVPPTGVATGWNDSERGPRGSRSGGRGPVGGGPTGLTQAGRGPGGGRPTGRGVVGVAAPPCHGMGRTAVVTGVAGVGCGPTEHDAEVGGAISGPAGRAAGVCGPNTGWRPAGRGPAGGGRNGRRPAGRGPAGGGPTGRGGPILARCSLMAAVQSATRPACTPRGDRSGTQVRGRLSSLSFSTLPSSPF